MAITIHTSPVSYIPSDNPVIYTFSSNQTAEDNFVYLVQVYINDVLAANEFVSPDNGIYGRIDVSNYTSNACQTPTINSSIVSDAANYCNVRITVFERYGTPPSNELSASTTNINAFKAKMQDDDFIDWIGGGYIQYVKGTFFNFLTNHPDNLSVRQEGEQQRLMLINNLTNISIQIYLYDENGDEVNNDIYASGIGSAFNISILNVDPTTIIANTGLTTGDFTASSYYTVRLFVSDSGFGILRRIDIDRSIVYSTYQRIHYLSNWGAIESFTLGLISRESGTVESFGYKQGFGQWSGNAFIFTKDRGRDIDYAKTVDKKLRLTSDWIGQGLQNFLCDNLYPSPLVYQEVGALMVRRRMSSKTYDKKIHENDMIFLEEIMLDLPSYNSMVI